MAAPVWLSQDRLRKVNAYRSTDNAQQLFDDSLKILNAEAKEIAVKRAKLKLQAETRVELQYKSLTNDKSGRPSSGQAKCATTTTMAAGGNARPAGLRQP